MWSRLSLSIRSACPQHHRCSNRWNAQPGFLRWQSCAYLQLVEVLPPELLSGLSGLSEQSSLVRPEGLVRDELGEVLVLLLGGVLRRVPDHAVLHDVPRLALARRLVRGGAGGAAAVAVDGVLRRDARVLEIVV